MARPDVVVIGASAGGVEALTSLVAGMPADYPGTLFTVLHVPANGMSVLPHILGRAGPLPALHPSNGTVPEPAHIYVAPPDHHMVLRDGVIAVTRGPKEHGHRPAVDPLFRSAAKAYGARVVGMILSGTLDDGTMGLSAVAMRGGTTIVQDPAEALFSGMIQSALEHVHIDYVAPVAEMGDLLSRLLREEVDEKGGAAMSEDMEWKSSIVEADIESAERNAEPGVPSVFSCPECHGILWELKDGQLTHFRCRTGHAYSIESLIAAQSDAVEAALWIALRSLEEKRNLAERVWRRARDRGLEAAATRFAQQYDEARQHAEVLRQAIHSQANRIAEVGDRWDAEQLAGAVRGDDG